jgi:hypothetical protein
MKQMTWITTVLFAVVMMGLMGCASGPEWFFSPPSDANFIYGTAVAVMPDEVLAWKTATNSSRQDLANQISTSIDNMQIDYSRTTGMAGGNNLFATVSQQLTNVILSGMRVVKRYVGPGNTYYVLTSFPRESIETVIIDAIQDESARNLRFQSEWVVEAMGRAIFKWSQPTPEELKAKVAAERKAAAERAAAERAAERKAAAERAAVERVAAEQKAAERKAAAERAAAERAAERKAAAERAAVERAAAERAAAERAAVERAAAERAAAERAAVERAAAEQAAAERKEKWDDFWEESKENWDDLLTEQERLFSVGASLGSSFAPPWLTGSIHGTASLFKYTFIDVGMDIGFIHGYEGWEDIDYFSLYPFGHFNGFVPFGEYNGWYAGVGGGLMTAFYTGNGEDNAFYVPIFDITTGVYLGNGSHYFTLEYTLRTPFERIFEAVNHKLTVGYSFRFGGNS